MGDFLQLSVKGRDTDQGLWDLLKSESESDKLKATIEKWLQDEEHLRQDTWEDDLVSPHHIGDTIMRRVCQIAGHVWIEFIQNSNSDETIRGLQETDIDRINAYLAEFLPKSFDRDHLFKTLGSDGEGVAWSEITPEQLRTLFDPLLTPSQIGRITIMNPKRRARGRPLGRVNFFSPDQIRGRSQFWLEDHRPAYRTPKWAADDIQNALTTLKNNETGLRYSFTPEYYSQAENCLTWVAKALDVLFADDWLTLLRTQCGIDPKSLDPACQDDRAIREMGSMKCMLEYSRRADEKRNSAGTGSV